MISHCLAGSLVFYVLVSFLYASRCHPFVAQILWTTYYVLYLICWTFFYLLSSISYILATVYSALRAFVSVCVYVCAHVHAKGFLVPRPPLDADCRHEGQSWSERRGARGAGTCTALLRSPKDHKDLTFWLQGPK